MVMSVFTLEGANGYMTVAEHRGVRRGKDCLQP